MPRVVFIFVFICLLFFQISPVQVFADHPECTDEIKGDFRSEARGIDNKGDGVSFCPTNTCYIYSPDVQLYTCFNIKEGTVTPPPPAPITDNSSRPNPTPLPPYPRENKSGVSCSLDPPIISITQSTTFRATGLDKNSSYMITLNNLNNANGRINLNTDDQGIIQTTIAPKAINIAFQSGYVLLAKKRIGSTTGDFICSAQLLISQTIGDLKGQKFFRCVSKDLACTEITDYTGDPNLIDSNPNQAECDAACSNEGKTFPSSKNDALSPSKVKACKSINDPDFVKDGPEEARDIPCLEAGGVSCDPTSGRAPGTGGIMTAIGCVPTDPQQFVTATLRVATFASGGIALLIMIFGVFRMITALGNPEAIKAGRDQFNAAIFGLLFIIFSVLLLEVIGVDILNLPGFGR